MARATSGITTNSATHVAGETEQCQSLPPALLLSLLLMESRVTPKGPSHKTTQLVSDFQVVGVMKLKACFVTSQQAGCFKSQPTSLCFGSLFHSKGELSSICTYKFSVLMHSSITHWASQRYPKEYDNNVLYFHRVSPPKVPEALVSLGINTK